MEKEMNKEKEYTIGEDQYLRMRAVHIKDWITNNLLDECNYAVLNIHEFPDADLSALYWIQDAFDLIAMDYGKDLNDYKTKLLSDKENIKHKRKRNEKK